MLGRGDASIVSTAQAVRYLHFTPMLAQMAHATDVRTTDTQLRMLSTNPNATAQVGNEADAAATWWSQCHCLWQVLAVLSPYNTLIVGVSQLWPKYKVLANYWFKQVCACTSSGVFSL